MNTYAYFSGNVFETRERHALAKEEMLKELRNLSSCFFALGAIQLIWPLSYLLSYDVLVWALHHEVFGPAIAALGIGQMFVSFKCFSHGVSIRKSLQSKHLMQNDNEQRLTQLYIIASAVIILICVTMALARGFVDIKHEGDLMLVSFSTGFAMFSCLVTLLRTIETLQQDN